MIEQHRWETNTNVFKHLKNKKLVQILKKFSNLDLELMKVEINSNYIYFNLVTERLPFYALKLYKFQKGI